MKQKAFTLIELLVVIAIIGLLTTLVLVNTSGTRGKARVAKALEYSSQIYNALGSEVAGIWNFDNGTGTIAYDTSGYSNNGTLTNGPLFATDTPYYVVGSGTGKYSLSFDGADDYVQISHNANQLLTIGGTIEAWIKPDTNGENNTGFIVDKSTGGVFGVSGYCISCTSLNRIFFRINNGTSLYTAENAIVYGSGNWYHIAVSWDATGYSQIYVNGVISGTPAISASPAGITSVNALAIGNRSGATDRTFDGFIDDVRIYSVALTASQVQQHYVEGIEKHQNF